MKRARLEDDIVTIDVARLREIRAKRVAEERSGRALLQAWNKLVQDRVDAHALVADVRSPGFICVHGAEFLAAAPEDMRSKLTRSDLESYADGFREKNKGALVVTLDGVHKRGCMCASQHKTCWFDVNISWTWSDTTAEPSGESSSDDD